MSDKFEFVKHEESNVEVIDVKFKSATADIFSKFTKNPVAIIGTVIFLILLITSIIVRCLPGFELGTGDSTLMDLNPSADHWFGTDSAGRDLWNRNWAAFQYSLVLALVATTINVLIATLVGLLMGYFDKFDKFFAPVIKVLYATPGLVVLILFSILFQGDTNLENFFVIILSLTVFGWVNASQQVRGIVKKTRNLDFVTASQTLGTSRFKMLGVFLVYAMPIIIVQFAIIFPNMIISEATLGFLGLSIPDLPTLGNLINDSRNSFLAHPYQILFPLMMLALTTISIQFIGFGLEDSILGKEGR